MIEVTEVYYVFPATYKVVVRDNGALVYKGRCSVGEKWEPPSGDLNRGQLLNAFSDAMGFKCYAGMVSHLRCAGSKLKLPDKVVYPTLWDHLSQEG